MSVSLLKCILVFQCLLILLLQTFANCAKWIVYTEYSFLPFPCYIFYKMAEVTAYLQWLLIWLK